jgi:hypothetical protein
MNSYVTVPPVVAKEEAKRISDMLFESYHKAYVRQKERQQP